MMQDHSNNYILWVSTKVGEVLWRNHNKGSPRKVVVWLHCSSVSRRNPQSDSHDHFELPIMEPCFVILLEALETRSQIIDIVNRQKCNTELFIIECRVNFHMDKTNNQFLENLILLYKFQFIIFSWSTMISSYGWTYSDCSLQ
jgi:hypothetical protein